MKIHFKSSVIFLLFALTLAFSITTFGQGTKGLVEGTVSDQNGAPIAGAIVTIENKITSPGFKKSITANEKGYFIFSEVPPGMYRIQATSKNFRDFLYDVEVLVDKSITINPMLEVGLVDDMFSTAEKVNTDFGIQTNLTKKINDDLPARTTFSSLLQIAPNVRPEVLAGGFQIDGASGSENVFFIDGQEVTNYRTGQLNLNNDLPFELLQEVTIKSGIIPAEYGGALGGVVTVVTPGGNNQWRGTFGISFAPEKLHGNPNLTINRFGSNAGQIEYFQPTKDGGAGYFPTASFSGPIVKDKLWFFSSYSPQIYNTTRTIDYFTSTNPATRTIRETIKYESNVRTEAAFLRFDSQPTSKLRMFGTFLYNPTIQDGVLPANTEGLGGAPQSVSGLRGADYLSTRGGRQNSNAVNGQISWDVAKNFLLNFRGGRGFLNEKLDSYGLPRTTRFLCSAAGSPETVPGSNCSRGFQNVSNNSIRDYDVSSRTTFDAESVISGINALGRHNFKFGYQFNRLFNSIKEGYFDTGIVNLFYGRSIDTLGIPVLPTAGNLGSGFLQRFGTVGETSNVNHALYAQDSWTIKNRLSLNLGIRFENENLPDYRKDLNLKFGWKDKIAPRFGFALDAFGNGKTKIFGGYGWFYDRLKYDVFQSQFPQLFYRDYFEILPSRGAAYTNYTLPRILGNNVDNPNGQCPIIGSSGWSVCQFSFSFVGLTNPVIVDTLPPVATDLKPMRSSEFSVGLEQNLGNNLLLSGLFIHRQLDRTVEDVSLINNQGTAVSTIGNPGFGRICEIASSVNLPCPKAERKYDAAEIRLDKRADSYFFNVSYTYSRLFGNYSGLASSDELGSISPNGTRYFDSPTAGFDANGDLDNGRLATDRPHVFKAFGGYSFDWNTNVNRTSISAFTTIQSGTPLTTNYSLYSISPSILFGRGDLGRTETFSETDLRISHHYKFGQDNKFSIEPYIVILNLFDERNELGRQTSISTTNFTSTALSQNGCTTCVSEATVYQTILNGTGISQFVQNFLNSAGVSSTGIRNDYNQPNLFQLQRNVRFGMRFSF